MVQNDLSWGDLALLHMLSPPRRLADGVLMTGEGERGVVESGRGRGRGE